ncbi:MAG: transposase family protein [Puniceicoccales bacterium]|nr:transposase family protein [Puniceicoccales bacterium]
MAGWSAQSSDLKNERPEALLRQKKQHTRKAIVIVDAKPRIGYLSPSKRGAYHDKRPLGQRQIVEHIPGKVTLLADGGLQGFRHADLCIPIKSSKRRLLDEQAREWSRLVSGHRIVVEHSIGGMKRYQLLRGSTIIATPTPTASTGSPPVSGTTYQLTSTRKPRHTVIVIPQPVYHALPAPCSTNFSTTGKAPQRAT